MKTCQGPGRKVRLRRKHRRDIDSHSLPTCLPQSAAGREKKTSMKCQNTAANAKKGYMPHDCKQYNFSSGTLESPVIWNIPALWPSTNLEVIQTLQPSFFTPYSERPTPDFFALGPFVHFTQQVHKNFLRYCLGPCSQRGKSIFAMVTGPHRRRPLPPHPNPLRSCEKIRVEHNSPPLAGGD